MLPKQTQLRIILYSTLLGLSTFLSSCGNSAQWEQFLSADPELKAQPTQDQGQNITLPEKTPTKSETIAENPDNTPQGVQLTKLPKKNSVTKDQLNQENQNEQEVTAEKSVADLPENLPFYPQALLQSIDPKSTSEEGVSEWRSPDNINTITDYYQSKWQDQKWQVIQPFPTTQDNSKPTAIVRQDNLDFTVTLNPVAAKTNNNQSQETQLTISYQPAQLSTVSESNSATSASEKSPIVNNNSRSNQVNSNSIFVTDLLEVPEQIRGEVKEVISLGVVTFKAKDTANNSFLFKPNETITRRQYAKWLVKANNKYYVDSPGNKIRLASQSSNPAFKDIGINDPDFPGIQGLAEAGLIPSVLTNDSSNLLFKPDAPLTREDLITWKVPLDTRQALPKADITAIEEAWGFQDASSINPVALPALFADYQNGDRSNLKRIFGYTTLFQPKKAVTRAEAAASLWYFGFQGDGITAKEILKGTE